MAINDVSLTFGMRSNLLSLQGTVDLLNRTQNRLSTGKKVNTAIDNPVSFFASQSLLSRASIIDSLKDAMGQAVQTITAADKGIKAITSMIEQAKGIAQSALSAPAPTSADVATGLISFSVIGAGDVITLGHVNFTATSSGTPGTDEFTVTGDSSTDMQALADAINAHDWSGATNTFAASVTYGVVISSTVTATGGVRAVTNEDFSSTFATHSAEITIVHSDVTGFDVGLIAMTGAVAGNSLQIGNTTFTAVNGVPAAFDTIMRQGQFQVTGNDATDMCNRWPMRSTQQTRPTTACGLQEVRIHLMQPSPMVP